MVGGEEMGWLAGRVVEHTALVFNETSAFGCGGLVDLMNFERGKII